MGTRNVDFPYLETTTYTMKIKVNPVNDVPEMVEAKQGQVITISSRGRLVQK